jgi:hypothetical protein
MAVAILQKLKHVILDGRTDPPRDNTYVLFNKDYAIAGHVQALHTLAKLAPTY